MKPKTERLMPNLTLKVIPSTQELWNSEQNLRLTCIRRVGPKLERGGVDPHQVQGRSCFNIPQHSGLISVAHLLLGDEVHKALILGTALRGA